MTAPGAVAGQAQDLPWLWAHSRGAHPDQHPGFWAGAAVPSLCFSSLCSCPPCHDGTFPFPSLSSPFLRSCAPKNLPNPSTFSPDGSHFHGVSSSGIQGTQNSLGDGWCFLWVKGTSPRARAVPGSCCPAGAAGQGVCREWSHSCQYRTQSSACTALIADRRTVLLHSQPYFPSSP